MQHPAGKKILKKLKKASVPRTAEEEAAAKDRGFRYYAQMRGVTSQVQLQALEYLVNGDKAQARQAITSMLDTLKRTSFGTKNDLSRASGCMLMAADNGHDLVRALEKEGIHKVALVAFKTNAGGNAFWEKIGFTDREDLVYRNKNIHVLQKIET